MNNNNESDTYNIRKIDNHAVSIDDCSKSSKERPSKKQCV